MRLKLLIILNKTPSRLVPQDESESETNDIDVDGEDVADGLDSDDDTG